MGALSPTAARQAMAVAWVECKCTTAPAAPSFNVPALIVVVPP